mmetsp:Transcript_20626/g.55194  ORF Transcript_20626/g.55194 Transcript_20626/m.55194 type:complete len:263 (+) Transcript_20626:207-995(+)
MARLLDRLRQQLQRLVALRHVGREAALVADVAGILAILLLDHGLQVMVDLGPDDHRLLEGLGADGEDHELLASQPVASVAAAVDNVEGRHWHDELVHRLPGYLRDVLVQRHLVRGGSCAADGHGDCQDRVRAELRLGPAPLVGGAVEGLHHQVVDLLLLGHVHADELRGDDVVHVRHCLEHALAEQPALVAVAQLEGLVDAGGGPAGHRGAEEGEVGAEVDLHGGVPPGVEDLARPDGPDHRGAGTACGVVQRGHARQDLAL